MDGQVVVDRKVVEPRCFRDAGQDRHDVGAGLKAEEMFPQLKGKYPDFPEELTFLHAEEILGRGVDTIACLSVNDIFVMNAWGKAQGVGDEVMMLADRMNMGTHTRAGGVTPVITCCTMVVTSLGAKSGI